MQRRNFLQYLGLAGASFAPGARALSSWQAPATVREQPLLLNQLGYQPAGAKQATVRGAAAGTGARDFEVHPANGKAGSSAVFRGKTSQPALDAASGDMAAVADFSALRTRGTYRLVVDGIASDAFPIRDDVYADALRVTMRGFTGQRCGCAVDLGGGYRHPACHAAGAFHPTSGKSGPLANHGGWHDAGDYGRYIVNSGISTGTLLWAWELYPQAVRSLHMQLPESGGRLPDYLAEIRWNLEWMLSLQDTDGGVFHKQTSEHFCAFIMPEADTLPSYVIGTGSAPYKSTCATADLAAVMAIAARCYGPYDPAFAQRCLLAAQGAWTWASAHPDVAFVNPPGITTGDYGDPHCGDELAWASAELWRSTGEPRYEAAFLSRMPDPGAPLTLAEPAWASLLPMACWTYALAARPGKPDPAKPAVKRRILDATHAAAAAMVERRGGSGYGNTLLLHDYGWGSNSAAGNQSLLLLISNHFQPDPATREAALGNLHYLFGRNCHDVSWVTQLGVRPFQHPHHRPSAADGIVAPWPGLLSGGPNAHGGDAVADRLPKAPPMRMWVDDQRAYSMNEIAINWNAPLVFLLAAANS